MVLDIYFNAVLDENIKQNKIVHRVSALGLQVAHCSEVPLLTS